MTYDSTVETEKHIRTVRGFLEEVVGRLQARGALHDQSKLLAPEKALFDEYTPLLSTVTYGSEEYRKYCAEMGVALDHHYAVNDHHPEHFENGTADMDLLQVIEMLADWKAATLRNEDGNLLQSINQNKERFGYGLELYGLLVNTAERLGWL